MQDFLAAHAHLARVGNDLVFLDVRADTYLCAPQLGARVDLSEPRHLRGLSQSDRLSLADAGLLSPRPTAALPPPPLPRQGLPSTTVFADPGDKLRLTAAAVDLAVSYPGRSFARLLRSVEPLSADAPSQADVLRLAQVFHRLVVWAPIGRKCLVRSYLLRRFLERSGCTAHWVFGVRTWPFGAHCWIQSGDVVLDDVPERLAPYQPILCI